MDYDNAQIAEIYDGANPLGLDGEFYLSLARTQPSDVLDLGCGTGTLCCALAGRGHRATGVDPAAAMLDVARRKLYADRVEWVEATAQSYRSARRFDLIVMTGHAFQCLLTDAEALAALETMRIHLKNGGTLAFETRNPQVDWAIEWATRPPRTLVSAAGPVVESLEVTGADEEFVSFLTSYQMAQGAITTNSTLRFPSREQVEELLARSGLLVRELFGGWDGSAFEAGRSREVIFVAASDSRG